MERTIVGIYQVIVVAGGLVVVLVRVRGLVRVGIAAGGHHGCNWMRTMSLVPLEFCIGGSERQASKAG